jgi:hypothetical protein
MVVLPALYWLFGDKAAPAMPADDAWLETPRARAGLAAASS